MCIPSDFVSIHGLGEILSAERKKRRRKPENTLHVPDNVEKGAKGSVW